MVVIFIQTKTRQITDMTISIKIDNATAARLTEVNKNGIVILRKKYGPSEPWTECSIEVAFDDFACSDRLHSDNYVYLSESLSNFLDLCEKKFTWQNTEKFMYKFINFSKLEAEAKEIRQADANRIRMEFGYVIEDDDFLQSL